MTLDADDAAARDHLDDLCARECEARKEVDLDAMIAAEAAAQSEPE